MTLSGYHAVDQNNPLKLNVHYFRWRVIPIFSIFPLQKLLPRLTDTQYLAYTMRREEQIWIGREENNDEISSDGRFALSRNR